MRARGSIRVPRPMRPVHRAKLAAMNLVACSDPHGRLDVARALAAATADAAVCAGDLGDRGRDAIPVLETLAGAARPLLVVSGNHDRLAELGAFAAARPHVHLLHGTRVEIEGVAFVGLGCAVALAEPSPSSEWLHEDEAAALLAPHASCDVLISHTPPRGTADRHFDGSAGGSVAVREAIARMRPSLCLCGHVHGSQGVRARLGATLVHNLGPAISAYRRAGAPVAGGSRAWRPVR